jgi:D-alanyl-D-alanine carboxypeptidase
MVMEMRTKRIIRAIIGLVLLAVLVFCIYKRLEAAPAPTEPDGETTTVPTEAPSEPSSEPEPTPTPEPTLVPTPTPVPTPALPDVDVTSWELRVANLDNNIGDYAPELVEVENGQKFDSRAADALAEFIAAAREEGLSVYLSSTYRDYATQTYLYNRKVAEYGEEIAKTIVAPPGTSEHQLGLAADITDQYYEYKNESLENTELFKWMSAHCAEYGFIVRYPKDKEDVTGIMYEPWHFRYVGKDAAEYIMEHGLCLEEFVALYAE